MRSNFVFRFCSLKRYQLVSSVSNFNIFFKVGVVTTECKAKKKENAMMPAYICKKLYNGVCIYNVYTMYNAILNSDHHKLLEQCHPSVRLQGFDK